VGCGVYAKIGFQVHFCSMLDAAYYIQYFRSNDLDRIPIKPAIPSFQW